MDGASNRRRFPRYDLEEPVTIVVGTRTSLPPVKVFTETLDISSGGARLRHPTRFIARPGELFEMSSPHIGEGRSARIIESSARGLHVAFEVSDPLIRLLGPDRSRR
jgi:c-di-GMP-binding flagellar brake protein YcgR